MRFVGEQRGSYFSFYAVPLFTMDETVDFSNWMLANMPACEVNERAKANVSLMRTRHYLTKAPLGILCQSLSEFLALHASGLADFDTLNVTMRFWDRADAAIFKLFWT